MLKLVGRRCLLTHDFSGLASRIAVRTVIRRGLSFAFGLVSARLAQSFGCRAAPRSMVLPAPAIAHGARAFCETVTAVPSRSATDKTRGGSGGPAIRGGVIRAAVMVAG